MLVLIGVAFIAGVVTAISPCVLPVLPVIFAGGAISERRRPVAIAAGLVASFTLFTLTASALLSALGLPEDLLRNIAIATLVLVGLALVWPPLGDVLRRPFMAVGRRAPVHAAGGFVLGASLGLVFTPCAGPVIAAIATVAATQRFSLDAVLITLAYAVGVGLVVLAFAVTAQRGFTIVRIRRHAPIIRPVLGALIVGAAVVMALNMDARLRTRVPEYTRALQALEQTAAASSAIDRLVGREEGVVEASKLDDYGPAPEFAGIAAWLNSRPLTLADLRGKVVVLDFWTYSCINCLRTLPYVKRWYDAYADAGLVVVGVHTPEFAFESVRANVQRAVRKFGITHPVALDNDYATWDAWGNRYWPAKYFIDRRGRVRFAHFGEGRYEQSEAVIRTLLGEPELPAPVSPSVEAERPEGIETPETYLGYDRLARLVGRRVERDREAQYRFPAAAPRNAVAFAGKWIVGAERIVASDHARLRLRYHARKVHLVLGVDSGVETVDVYVDSRYTRRVVVSDDGLHTLVSSRGRAADHLLELRFSPGTQAYAFTFG